jgi:hypothetical protein
MKPYRKLSQTLWRPEGQVRAECVTRSLAEVSNGIHDLAMIDALSPLFPLV